MQLAFEQPGLGVKRFILMTKSREPVMISKKEQSTQFSVRMAFLWNPVKITNDSMLYFITYYADSVLCVLLVNVHL